jgi:hypothetical protein
MWYLMQAGKRWPVMRQHPGEPAEAVQRALREWLEANAFTSGPTVPPSS